MSINEFEKQREALISRIRIEISGVKELESMNNHLNRIIAKKSTISKKGSKDTFLPPAYYSRTRVPAISSLKSTNNITHDDALNQINEIIESWK